MSPAQGGSRLQLALAQAVDFTRDFLGLRGAKVLHDVRHRQSLLEGVVAARVPHAAFRSAARVKSDRQHARAVVTARRVARAGRFCGECPSINFNRELGFGKKSRSSPAAW